MKKPYQRRRKKPDHREHRTQVAIFQWSKMNETKYPELQLLHSSLNGVNMNIREAKRAKDAGMKKGFPDLCLCVARGGFIGLYIELKEGNNKPTVDQERILKALGREGHLPLVVRGFETAIKIIEDYLLGRIKKDGRKATPHNSREEILK